MRPARNDATYALQPQPSPSYYVLLEDVQGGLVEKSSRVEEAIDVHSPSPVVSKQTCLGTFRESRFQAFTPDDHQNVVNALEKSYIVDEEDRGPLPP